MIIHADILTWAAAYDGPLFHALICDPPYHLTSITDRFGKADSAPVKVDEFFDGDGNSKGASPYSRVSKGFMGKDWDGGDIAFRPETWAALGRLLHPGAFGMAFASTRGFHRMAVAIEGLVGIPINEVLGAADLLYLARQTKDWSIVEQVEAWLRHHARLEMAIADAGFIIHPMICWNFASGFPKATRLDVQIDRAAGVEPTVIGTKKHAPKFDAAGHGYREKDNGYNSKDRESFDLTSGTTPLAQAWAGHRYGMQAMKPAIEPIIVFQKPYQGRPVESITRTGAGAINIEQGRIGAGSTVRSNRAASSYLTQSIGQEQEIGDEYFTGSDIGRWPANLVLSHAPTCNGTCAPGCPVAALGEQSGESESKAGGSSGTNANPMSWTELNIDRPREGHDDSGTAARFFFNADYALDRLEQNDPLIYVPKASTTEREAGLSDFDPTTVDDGRKKSIDNAYQRGETQRRNTHPTIKPISLARHLATLLLPPELYAPRRLLVPFAGAGSEMIGAMLAGWEDVQGIELEAEHVAIAEARLAFWQQMKYKLMNPDTPVKVTINRAPDGQADMFESEAA